MWVRSIMLNAFTLESSDLILLNISLSNSTGRKSEGALGETVRVQNTASTTQWGQRGIMRNTRNTRKEVSERKQAKTNPNKKT